MNELDGANSGRADLLQEILDDLEQRFQREIRLRDEAHARYLDNAGLIAARASCLTARRRHQAKAEALATLIGDYKRKKS